MVEEAIAAPADSLLSIQAALDEFQTMGLTGPSGPHTQSLNKATDSTVTSASAATQIKGMLIAFIRNYGLLSVVTILVIKYYLK